MSGVTKLAEKLNRSFGMEKKIFPIHSAQQHRFPASVVEKYFIFIPRRVLYFPLPFFPTNPTDDLITTELRSRLIRFNCVTHDFRTAVSQVNPFLVSVTENDSNELIRSRYFFVQF